MSWHHAPGTADNTTIGSLLIGSFVSRAMKLVRWSAQTPDFFTTIASTGGWLKDRRRVATRYDRCAKTFLSAVAIAATVMFWL
jgi:hypothetical protein